MATNSFCAGKREKQRNERVLETHDENLLSPVKRVIVAGLRFSACCSDCFDA